MSSNNDEFAGMAMIAAVFGWVIIFYILVIFAILAFVTLILTILALLAWNEPLQIGDLIVEPEEAQQFVLFGIAGAIILPVFIGFSSLLFDVAINWDESLFYIVLVGYIAGSFGVEVILGEEDTPSTEYDSHPTLENQPTELEPEPKGPSAQIFRFADWNDEEKGEPK